MRKPLITLLAAIAAVTLFACTEQLDAGKSCPLLCPEQAISLKDTTIDAVVVDTTIVGLPPIGGERFLMLSSHGDTLETRTIVRFDTIPATFTKAGGDSSITEVDSAFIVVPRAFADSLRRPKGPITIEAYDVDTSEADTVSSVLASLFRPDRFLGSRTYAPESLHDSVSVPISTDTVLNRVNSGARFRIGLRLVTSQGQGFDLRLGTTESGTPAELRIVASLDTSATAVLVAPVSNSPPQQLFLSAPLADYTIVVRGATPAPPGLIAVGGVPSRRTFLRFDLPSHIVDSTTIVRASLLLTQSPNRRVDANDTVVVYPLAILASPRVTNIASQLQFEAAPGFLGLDSLILAPGDSGPRAFEIAGLARTWRGQPLTVSPRTLGLSSAAEGEFPAEIDFFSTSAAPSLRPRLRITYVPQTNFGLP
ncbi:MAG: hypothetical protein ACHQWU_08330 [Gemmatimonadales bacterium]